VGHDGDHRRGRLSLTVRFRPVGAPRFFESQAVLQRLANQGFPVPDL
jgi:hypothetical protein